MATSGRGATVITDRGGQRASTVITDRGGPRVHLRWLDAAAALEARRAWIGSRPFGTGCGVLGSAKVGECVCVCWGVVRAAWIKVWSCYRRRVYRCCSTETMHTHRPRKVERGAACITASPRRG